jgi:serine/threonine protein kinase
MAEPSGELLGGRYRLLGERTTFPFGEWWEAEDDQGARTLVLRMSAEVADPAAKAEAALAACARVDTPHLVPWADGGVDAKGRGWLAAPMFGPWSLTEHLTRSEGVPPAEAALLIHQVTRAVAAGEAQGLLHHALSSEFVRLVPLPEGGYGVKIYGYGLADLLPSYKPLRKQESYLGVPDYMAPELCSGKAAEGSSADVYAVGILMYEGVRGRPPFAPTFASASASTTLKRHIFEKPLPLHVRYANAPFIKSYEAICFKALGKTPNRRQLTVGELEQELEQLITGEMRGQVVPLALISGRNPSTSRRLRTQVLPSAPAEEVEAKRPEPEAKKPEPEAKKPEPEAKKPEPEAKKPEPEVKKPEPEAKKPEPEEKKQVPEAKRPEPELK